MSIQVKNINKSFEKFKALDNVSLNVPGGELLALLGPSGSGKTTLLRIIAGLEQPDASPDSAILFDGIDVTRSPVGSRRVGFVFQHYALFKHMSVLENVAFGMRVKARKDRRPRSEIKDKALELIKLVQLENMANRLPSQLSGGQRQRVALARALAVEPKVLLLDEPFGALDARVRQDLRRWLRKLHDEIHVTSVFVTHDQEEALEVADKVVVMNQGRIEQVGTPDEVFHNPANSFVMHFLGHVNLFHGRMDGGQAVLSEQENPSRLMVRPFDLNVTTAPSQGTLPVQVTRIQSAGPVVKIDLTAPDGQIFQAELPHEKFRELAIKQSDNVFIAPRAAKIFREDYSI